MLVFYDKYANIIDKPWNCRIIVIDVARDGQDMTQQSSIVSAEKKREASVCRHHWLIEAPSGPVSWGVCCICGITSEFKNYIDSASWDDGVNTIEQTELRRDSVAYVTVPPEESDEG